MTGWNIVIQKERESVSTWTFHVRLRDDGRSFEYRVGVDKHKGLAHTGVSPRILVQESMLFLLEREPPEAILAEFDLKDISSYFPEYDEVIKERIGRL